MDIQVSTNLNASSVVLCTAGAHRCACAAAHHHTAAPQRPAAVLPQGLGHEPGCPEQDPSPSTPTCQPPLPILFCSVQVGWRRKGLGLWSPSGCRLVCSLRQAGAVRAARAPAAPLVAPGYKPALPLSLEARSFSPFLSPLKLQRVHFCSRI